MGCLPGPGPDGWGGNDRSRFGERYGECRQSIAQGADLIGETGADRVLAEEEPRLGGAHGIGRETSVAGDGVDEERIDTVDLGLQRPARAVLQGFVRVEVVLGRAGIDGGGAEPLHGVPRRAVDMDGDDADRAEPPGARHDRRSAALAMA